MIGLRTPNYKNFNFLTDQYLKIAINSHGVKAKVFYPSSYTIDSVFSGANDSEINYEDIPDMELEVLIPIIFSLSFYNQNTSNSYNLDDIILYSNKSEVIPLNSKIEISFEDKTYKFKVLSGNFSVYNKYKLVWISNEIITQDQFNIPIGDTPDEDLPTEPLVEHTFYSIRRK